MKSPQVNIDNKPNFDKFAIALLNEKYVNIDMSGERCPCDCDCDCVLRITISHACCAFAGKLDAKALGIKFTGMKLSKTIRLNGAVCSNCDLALLSLFCALCRIEQAAESANQVLN